MFFESPHQNSTSKTQSNQDLGCLSAMAALFLGHSCRSRNCSSQALQSKNCPRILITISCQSRIPIDRPGSEIKARNEKEKEKKQFLPELLVSADNFGKRLKDGLSPKQNGDWKDLVLMSLSFAVYVYVSQKIVCAYCAWMSMLKQPW